ncbi:glycosyltransferase family 4 protein [Sphingomonas sp. ac-8]|uniref:glycosyltransferase family 4 protein n=1 Tax=Sphingomonas sp. ac-8 TaxID=3242977 RepID=UPI003A80C3F0
MAARILITADAVGGVWQYATDLACALAPLGFAPTVAVLGPEPSAAQRAPVEAAGIPILDTGLPLDWLCDGPVPVREAGEALAALVREQGFDLVHCNMPTLAASGAFGVPLVAVAHGCLATWWDAARGTPLPPEFRWQRTLTEQGFRAADRVVAPTAAFAAVIQRSYGLAEPPLAVHNGRRPLCVGEGEPVDSVFTAGRLWDQVKQTRLLDRVAARLPVPFHAAGPLVGPHGEQIAANHLHPLGVLNETELAGWLAQRPIFVSAARFEPFGLAVLEAAAAGCPLVLADLPTFRELWEGAATFVAPHDQDGFVAAIETLRADPARRIALGEAAQVRAARYTPAAVARDMAALYRELLDPAATLTRSAAA